jgi:hypothetical protein
VSSETPVPLRELCAKATPGKKTCTKCKVEKSLDEFHRQNRTCGLGRKAVCKQCASQVSDRRKAQLRINSRNWAARHPDQIAAKNCRWSKIRPRKYPTSHKEIARNKLRQAVYYGRIYKPTKCEICGSVTPLDGHHNDYSLPLIVEWLCRKCHGKKHRLESIDGKTP